MEPCVFVQHGSPEAKVVVWFALALLIAFVVLDIVAIKLLICCKIFSKAGYSWALGLLMLIPIVNIIMAFFLAFANWPVQKELRRLKQQQSQS
jgi:Kef-type K+ transport system membrane component KefB